MSIKFQKRNKYKAQPLRVDGHYFHSTKEAKRYQELKLLEKAGEITRLELQPPFPVSIDGELICTYRADFSYFEGQKRVVEDVKGFKTAVYKLKKKLVEASYRGLKIVEI